jgi:murein tripeptide amidase MpaA
MKFPRIIILASALALLICGVSLGAEQNNEEYIQARIKFSTIDQQMTLLKMHLDVMHATQTFYEIVTNSEEVAQLKNAGFDVEIIHEDMVAMYQSRFPDKDKSGYLTLSQINAELYFYHLMYPDITTERISIGQSLEGREIYAIKISDNPDVDEDEPEVFFNAAIHAREVITPLVLLHFMDHLLSNYGTDPEITALVDEREIWLVPVVNADGYQYNVDYAWPGAAATRPTAERVLFPSQRRRFFAILWRLTNL